MLLNPIQLIISPSRYWQSVGQMPTGRFTVGIIYFLIMAALPSIALYYGTVHQGWSVSEGLVKFTAASGMGVAAAVYFAIVVMLTILGLVVHLLAKGHKSESTLLKGVAVVGIAFTPLYLGSLSMLYRSFWLHITLAGIAIVLSMLLLHKDIPLVMNISKEDNVIYFGAISALALYVFTVCLGIIVFLWDSGFLPVFVD